MPMFTSEKALRSLRKTPVILAGILDNVSQERAQQATDGPDGWNGIEIVGHLLDYEEIFFERAKRMLAEDKPALEGYDQDALVKDHDYAHQNLQDVFQRFVTLRRTFINLLTTLTDEEWARQGVHPQSGEITVLEHAINITLHDVNHIEQIVRTVGAADASV